MNCLSKGINCWVPVYVQIIDSILLIQHFPVFHYEFIAIVTISCFYISFVGVFINLKWEHWSDLLCPWVIKENY